MESTSLLHFFDVPPSFPWSGAMGDFGVSEQEKTLRTSYPEVVEIQLFCEICSTTILSQKRLSISYPFKSLNQTVGNHKNGDIPCH
jgi:hypothetical protein